MQPNIKTDLLIAASDQRRETIASVIPRPTFARPKAAPAPGSAASVPAPKLLRKMEQIGRRKSPAGVSGDEGLLLKKSEVHEKIC